MSAAVSHDGVAPGCQRLIDGHPAVNVALDSFPASTGDDVVVGVATDMRLNIKMVVAKS